MVMKPSFSSVASTGQVLLLDFRISRSQTSACQRQDERVILVVRRPKHSTKILTQLVLIFPNNKDDYKTQPTWARNRRTMQISQEIPLKSCSWWTVNVRTRSSWSSAKVWQDSSGLSSLSSGMKGHQMSRLCEFSGVSSGLRMCTTTSSLRGTVS